MDTSYRKYLPGWAPHIDQVVTAVQTFNVKYAGPTPEDSQSIVILQIKEKFGGLRIYTRWSNVTSEDAQTEAHQIFQLIDQICATCEGLCQDCGEPGDLVNIGGWAVTLCEKHHVERGAKRARGDYS